MDAPWLITGPEPYDEYQLGSLKTGKEAEVFLVERVARDGRSCLLAHKRYRPKRATRKGELQELGFQRASTFVHDQPYRDGRAFANTRDRRAAAKRSRYGRTLLGADWADNEFAMLERLHAAGVAVPAPVDRSADGILMQYLGDHTAAAPRLVHARLDARGVLRAASALREELARMTAAGVVHGDLSVYNLLWWEDRLWVIDVPQAVDIAAHPQALDFLHRDLSNVATWFVAHGAPFDPDDVFADLLSDAFG